MRFFIPGANDRGEAITIYGTIRRCVEQRYGPLKPTLIYLMRFHYGGTLYTVAVGDSLKLRRGAPIKTIFEGGDYYICSGPYGEPDSNPLVVRHADVLHVELFDESSERTSLGQPPSSPAISDPNYDPMEEKAIAQLAYELWEHRGKPIGSADEDWYAAAKMIRDARDLCTPLGNRADGAAVQQHRHST